MRQPFRHTLLAPFLCLALVVSGCESFTLDPPPPAEIRADAANVVDPREIVALVPDAASARSLLTGAQSQGFALRERVVLPGLRLHMLRMTIPAPLNGAGAIAALETLESRATAGVNHAYAPAVQTSSLDYANSMIGWPDRACPALTPIGMIDTGVDTSIPELSSVQVVTNDLQRGAAAPLRHGTEVAAVLADPRRLSGVTLYSAGVIGTSARGLQETGVDSLLEALDWLDTNDVKLVNISLAGPYNKLLDRGIDVAASHGMTIVAAVGNDGADAAPRYPAALENVIAVTAVDAGGAIYDRAVRGPHVDLAAPGVDVMLTIGGRPRFVSGTSIAAPFVTARLAADPARAHGTLRRDLGSLTTDIGPQGPDPIFGTGLLAAASGC